MNRLLLLFALTLVILPSCTLEKRLFRKGWHVEWKHRHETAGLSEKETAEAPDRIIHETAANVAPVKPVDEPVPAAETPDPETEVPAAAREDAVAIPGDDPGIVYAPLAAAEKNPTPDETTDPQTGRGLGWLIVLCVSMALAATIWLAAGTGGSSVLLVALFVVLFASVVGAIAISLRLKRTKPEEEEVDIEFDELTQNEIKRKKKMKALISVLVLVLAVAGIIIAGS